MLPPAFLLPPPFSLLLAFLLPPPFSLLLAFLLPLPFSLPLALLLLLAFLLPPALLLPCLAIVARSRCWLPEDLMGLVDPFHLCLSFRARIPVWVPLKGQTPVCNPNFVLRSGAIDAKDFVVIRGLHLCHLRPRIDVIGERASSWQMSLRATAATHSQMIQEDHSFRKVGDAVLVHRVKGNRHRSIVLSLPAMMRVGETLEGEQKESTVIQIG